MTIRVSVIIPTFNRQAETDAAVESVVSQYPSQIEILVVDDASETPYLFCANRNSSGIPVEVLQLERNGGPSAARAAAVSRCTGTMIAFLDSDDTYCPAWIDQIIEIISSQPQGMAESLVIAGQAKGGSVVNRTVLRFLHLMPSAPSLEAARVTVAFFNPLYTPAFAASRELLRFSPNLRHCEDYFTNALAILLCRSFIAVDTFACELGRTPNSLGGLSSSHSRMLLGEMYVRSRILFFRATPLHVRLLIPFGFIYQLSRVTIKYFIKIFLSCIRIRRV